MRTVLWRLGETQCVALNWNDGEQRGGGEQHSRMSDFRKLDVWHNSHARVLNVHGAVKKIRGSDYASLRSQMLRAGMSIPTNLVEGVGQKTAREFARFIRISLNSANELEYHLLLARDLEVMPAEEFSTLVAQTIQVRKMLHGLLKRVDGRSNDSNQKRSPRR